MTYGKASRAAEDGGQRREPQQQHRDADEDPPSHLARRGATPDPPEKDELHGNQEQVVVQPGQGGRQKDDGDARAKRQTLALERAFV